MVHRLCPMTGMIRGGAEKGGFFLSPFAINISLLNRLQMSTFVPKIILANYLMNGITTKNKGVDKWLDDVIIIILEF